MFAGGIEIVVGVHQVATIEAALYGSDDAIGHLRVKRGRVAPAAELLGVMREALVQPEHLTCAAAHEDVLVEAYHVLEFVDERHRDEPLQIRSWVGATERAGRIGDDRVKDLSFIRSRVVLVRGIEIRAEEEAGDETVGVALGRGHKLVHRSEEHTSELQSPYDL